MDGGAEGGAEGCYRAKGEADVTEGSLVTYNGRLYRVLQVYPEDGCAQLLSMEKLSYCGCRLQLKCLAPLKDIEPARQPSLP